MSEKSISVSQVHARNDTHTCFKEFSSNLPQVTKFTDTMCCIPVGWWVTDEKREYIADTVIKYCTRSF